MRFTSKDFKKCLDGVVNGEINAILFSGSNYGLATIMGDELENAFQAEEKVFIDYQDDKKDSPFIQNLRSNLQSGFFSSKRLIKVFNIENKRGISKEIGFLDEEDFRDKLILFFGEELQSRSELKTFFEKGEKVACVDLYEDTEEVARSVIGDFFNKRGIQIDNDAIVAIAKMLHGDRLALLQECEKMIYYCGDKKITCEDVDNAIENEQKGDLIGFIDNLLAGNSQKAVEEFDLLVQEDIQMIMLLRFFIRQVQEIWELKQAMNNGKTWEEIGARIFWKRKGLVKIAVSKITQQVFDKYVKLALQTEKMTKEHGNEIARSFFVKSFLLHL